MTIIAYAKFIMKRTLKTGSIAAWHSVAALYQSRAIIRWRCLKAVIATSSPFSTWKYRRHWRYGEDALYASIRWYKMRKTLLLVFIHGFQVRVFVVIVLELSSLPEPGPSWIASTQFCYGPNLADIFIWFDRAMMLRLRTSQGTFVHWLIVICHPWGFFQWFIRSMRLGAVWRIAWRGFVNGGWFSLQQVIGILLFIVGCRLQNTVIDLEVANHTASPTVDPSVHVFLIGHSMGGIIATETLLLLDRKSVV